MIYDLFCNFRKCFQLSSRFDSLCRPKQVVFSFFDEKIRNSTIFLSKEPKIIVIIRDSCSAPVKLLSGSSSAPKLLFGACSIFKRKGVEGLPSLTFFSFELCHVLLSYVNHDLQIWNEKELQGETVTIIHEFSDSNYSVTNLFIFSNIMIKNLFILTCFLIEVRVESVNQSIFIVSLHKRHFCYCHINRTF